MRYILYARKSSESEDRQVQSIDDQQRILRTLAQERGFEVTEEIEESRSAKDPGARPGFDRMLTLIEKGKADAILCWNVNRLSRNPIDSGRLSWLLQQGVLQVIQTPEKPYLPSDNVLIFSVETGMANQYILDLKKAVRRGTDSKLAKGWFPHRAPEGYANNLRDHTIEPDSERFALIQRGWRLLIAGTHTPSRVINLLNDDWGYRTRDTGKSGGDKLSRSAGYRLFSNLFYAGYFQHAGTVYKGAHVPMITLAEFDQVQKRLSGQVGKAHYKKHEFAYTGLMRCGQCGGGVTAEAQTGRHGRGAWSYYHCGNSKNKCSKRSIREDVLEERINDCLSQITITAEFREIVLAALEVWLKQEFSSQEAKYGQQLRALEVAERMRNELMEIRLRGLIDDARYQAKEKELVETVNGLRLSVDRTQQQMAHTRQVVTNALNFRQHARAQFLTGDLAKRREIARALGVRYVLKDMCVYIELNPLLTPMQLHSDGEENAAEKRVNLEKFEPPKTGFDSTKKTFSDEKVSVGWTGGIQSGSADLQNVLFAMFRHVAKDESFFPALQWDMHSN